MRLVIYGIVVVLLGYLAVFYASPVISVICVVWACMPVISVVAAWYTIKKLRIYIENSVPVCEVGQTAVLRLRIQNGSRLPVARLWIDVRFRNHYEEKWGKDRLRAAINGRSQGSVDIALKGEQVGILELEVERYGLWDMLRCFRLRRQCTMQTSVVLLPHIYPIELEEGDGQGSA